MSYELETLVLPATMAVFFFPCRMDPSTGGYTGLQNHDVDVLRHFEDGMQSWYTNQQGSQGQLNDYAALMAMLQGDEVEASTHMHF